MVCDKIIILFNGIDMDAKELYIELQRSQFATLGGKIFISILDGFGILSFAASLVRYVMWE